jgi:hypothetical protein
VGAASTKEAVTVGVNVPLTFGKETDNTDFCWNDCDMEYFERLSDKVLNRTCPCGIIFKTYDPKKVYHSNNCKAICVRKRNGAIVQRKKLKQKKLKEQS